MTSSNFPEKYEATESSPETKITTAFDSLNDTNTISTEDAFANSDQPVFDAASSDKIFNDLDLENSKIPFSIGDENTPLTDNTEEPDFYDKKFAEYEKNFDNQFTNKVYKKVGDILPKNLKSKYNTQLEVRKQKALKDYRNKLKFAEENADSFVGQTVRGFLAAYPMAINELYDGGINFFREIAGQEYKEFEIFDIDGITESLTMVDPEQGNKNVFDTVSIMTRFIVGSNAVKGVGNKLSGGVNPVTGLGKFDYKPVNYSLKGAKVQDVANFFHNRALGFTEDFIASVLFLDSETDNFFKVFEPLVNKVPQLDTALYRFLTSTDPKEDGFILSKLKFGLAEALPFQLGYTGIRGLNRSGRIGFKTAFGETVDLGRFLVDGTVEKIKAIKKDPLLVERITQELISKRGFRPDVNYKYIDDVQWNHLTLDQKIEQLYKRNDIVVESLADEDNGKISYINKAIAELDTNGTLTEDNLKQLLDIKGDEAATPFMTNLDSGKGLFNNRGKEYLKERLKFLNFKNRIDGSPKEGYTYKNAKTGDVVTYPPIRFQKLSDGDYELLNGFVDNLAGGRLNDVSFSINSKIGAAGRFNFENKLVEINGKIFEEGDFSRTYIHELWHTLSRYLPDVEVKKLRKEFAKKRNKYLQNFDANKKDYINTKDVDTLLVDALESFEQTSPFAGIRRANVLKNKIFSEMKAGNLKRPNDTKTFKKIANEFLERNKFTNENYRYTNIDEYFAETMTDEFFNFEGRLPDAEIGTWKRLGQEIQEYFRTIMANVRAKFGDTRTTKIFNDFNSNNGQFKYKKTDLPIEYRNFDDMNKVDYITYKRNGNRPNRKGIGAPKGDGRGGDAGGGDAGRPTGDFDMGDQDSFMKLPHVRKQFEMYSILKQRVKALEADGLLGKSRTQRSLVENAIELLSNTPELKARAETMAQILDMNPLPELNYALAEQITLLARKNNDVAIRLKTAIANEDFGLVDANMEKFLDNMKEIDDWIELAVPIGSETGAGLYAMSIPTKGIDPEEWAKLSPAEKFQFRVKTKEEVIFNNKKYSKRFSDFQQMVQDAHAEALKTGDYMKLDNLFGVLNRAGGDPQKLQKLFEMNLLTSILNDKIISPMNDLSINLLLFHPATQIVNFTSNALEALFFSAEMMGDPYMIYKLFKGDTTMFEENLRAVIGYVNDFNFVNETFTKYVTEQSWLNQTNIINPRNTKLENVSQNAFSSQILEGQVPFTGREYNILGNKFKVNAMEIKNTKLGQAISALIDSKPLQGTLRYGSNVMQTMDGMFQAGAINSSQMFYAYRDGLKLGKTGGELNEYVMGRLKAAQELFINKSQKVLKRGVIDDDLAKAMQGGLEFAKRQTFTEPMFTEGFIFGQAASSLNRFTSTSPLAKRFMFFLRSPVNITKRGFERTGVINLLMPSMWQKLNSPDPLVARQARGRLFLGNILLAPAFFAKLKEGNKNDPINPPNVIFQGTESKFLGINNPNAKFEKDALTARRNAHELDQSVGFLQKNDDGTPKIGDDGKPKYEYYQLAKLDPTTQTFINQLNLFDLADKMPEQTFQEFVGLASYYTVRSFLNSANMFGVEDLFKFVNDPTDAGNGFFRNILTSFAPRALKDTKHDIGYGLNKTGIMSDKEFEGLKSKKMLSSRFDEDGWWKNFRVELNKYIPFAGEGFDENGYEKFPYEREIITNERVKKTYNRKGLNLLNFIVSSESRNHPIFSNFQTLNYFPQKPSVNSKVNFKYNDQSTGLVEQAEVGLTTPLYNEMIGYVNTATFPKGTKGYKLYGDKTLEESLTAYFDLPYIKAHMEEIEDYKSRNKVVRYEGIFKELRDKVLNGDPAVGSTIGIRDIYADYVRLGKEMFFYVHRTENSDFIQNAIMEKQKKSLLYNDTIKNNQTFQKAYDPNY